MPIPLSRILANRPKGGALGKEWIGRSSLPRATMSMGCLPGCWDAGVVSLPLLLDGGVALSLCRTLVARCDDFWEPGLASVWEVTACQEDSHYVPGVRLFVDPHPPCLLCQPCIDGNHWLCRHVGIRRWEPGWISAQTILPAWTTGRGVFDLSHRASEKANLFVEPLSRLVHSLSSALSRRPRRITVLGADLPGVLAGFALERMIPDSKRCLFDELPARLHDAKRFGYQTTAPDQDSIFEGLDGRPELVVVTVPGSEPIALAIELCAPGGTVLLIAPPPLDASVPGLADLWRRGIRILSGIGRSPDRLVQVRDWIEEIADRLEPIPVAELPFEQGACARALLDADPNLLGVVLLTQESG